MTSATYTDSASTLDANPAAEGEDVIDLVNRELGYEYVARDAWVSEKTVLSTEGVAEGIEEALRELREPKGSS